MKIKNYSKIISKILIFADKNLSKALQYYDFGIIYVEKKGHKSVCKRIDLIKSRKTGKRAQVCSVFKLKHTGETSGE